MKKLAGVFLGIIGIILIIFSIIVLVKAFDAFSAMGSSTDSIGYTIGSIIFPLLLTVTGRWIFRKGLELRRNGPEKNNPSDKV